jgi:hypothetical protein
VAIFPRLLNRSAWVCLAAGAGSSGYGRDPYYVQDAKIIALRTARPPFILRYSTPTILHARKTRNNRGSRHRSHQLVLGAAVESGSARASDA